MRCWRRADIPFVCLARRSRAISWAAVATAATAIPPESVWVRQTSVAKCHERIGRSYLRRTYRVAQSGLTRTYPDASYYAKFHMDEDGDVGSIHHGWCFDSFAIVNGHEVKMLQALRFADTMDGILSAFFVSVILPTIGAYWHGLYERDYQLIESPGELNEAMFSDNLKEAIGNEPICFSSTIGKLRSAGLGPSFSCRTRL
jgi:hypothetical protein